MPKKINRNAKRLNALFEIIRFVNTNPPLIQEELDTIIPVDSGIVFPQLEEIDNERVDPIANPPINDDISFALDFFDNDVMKIGIVSRNPLVKRELTRGQKIIKLIDDNPKKIEDIQKNLNMRSDKHFTLAEAQRITFLSLEDNPELTLADVENDKIFININIINNELSI